MILDFREKNDSEFCFPFAGLVSVKTQCALSASQQKVCVGAVT